MSVDEDAAKEKFIIGTLDVEMWMDYCVLNSGRQKLLL